MSSSDTKLIRQTIVEEFEWARDELGYLIQKVIYDETGVSFIVFEVSNDPQINVWPDMYEQGHTLTLKSIVDTVKDTITLYISDPNNDFFTKTIEIELDDYNKKVYRKMMLVGQLRNLHNEIIKHPPADINENYNPLAILPYNQLQ